MMRIVLATRNEGKVRELERLFDEPRIDLISMKTVLPDDFEVEETGETFEENAWLKAEQVALATGYPAIADDSGLEVDALGKRPGVYSARYAGPHATDEDNNRLLLSELDGVTREQRTARFVCVLAFASVVTAGSGQGSRVARIASTRGVVEGRIVTAPKGSGGFGYDPLFEPLERIGMTTAQLSFEEKNRISHRGRAALGLKASLGQFLDSEG